MDGRFNGAMGIERSCNSLLSASTAGRMEGYGQPASPPGPPSPHLGRRVVVSRLGGPDYRPPEYHYAGHVSDIDAEAVTVDFGPSVGTHVFSMNSGAWLRGTSLLLEDCCVQERWFGELIGPVMKASRA
jgi:hypothetical protein